MWQRFLRSAARLAQPTFGHRSIWTASCAVTASAAAAYTYPRLNSSEGQKNLLFSLNSVSTPAASSNCEALPSADGSENTSSKVAGSPSFFSSEQESASTFHKRRLTLPAPPEKVGEKDEVTRSVVTTTDVDSEKEILDFYEKEKSKFHLQEETQGLPKSAQEEMRVMHAIEIEDILPATLRRMKTKQVDQHLLDNDIRFLHRPLQDGLYDLSLEKKVGAFSCHGIEPRVFVVHDWKTIFTHMSERTLVTILKKKINQDRGHFTFSYGNCPKTALFAAYDGHGPRGELISQYAMHAVQNRLHKHPDYKTNLQKAFHDTFLQVDKDLRERGGLYPMGSGSTACVILLRDRHLYVANLGDSRAVLARKKKPSTKSTVANDSASTSTTDRTSSSCLEAVAITKDQTASCPTEKERVLQSGGYVSMPGQFGTKSRIWLDPAFTKVGLSMTRSFGDIEVKETGVIAEPVVTERVLTDEDEFIIVATDGVWEFIDSQEAVRIVESYFAEGHSASEACLGLIQAAIKKWREVEGDYRDDITAVVVRVSDLWNEQGSDQSRDADEERRPTPGSDGDKVLENGAKEDGSNDKHHSVGRLSLGSMYRSITNFVFPTI